MRPIPRRRFLVHSTLVAGAGALHGPQLLARPEAPLVAVPEVRLKRLSKGANVCGWFRFAPKASPEHFRNYIPESEAQEMARLGLRHVRLCIVPPMVMDPATGALLEDRVREVEAAIARFHRAGLLVVVDPHNEDRKVELDPAWQDAFVRFWGAFAARLSVMDPDLTVLETVNEPVFSGRDAEWNALNERLLAAMRRAAPAHTLMTSGPGWGGIDGLLKLKPVADRNVVYSFHCYDPFPFTHQGATWAGPDVKPLRGVPYPSSPEAVAGLLPGLEASPGSKALVEKYGSERWNRERLAARFRQGIDWGAWNGVPLYCGEFGVYPPFAKPEDRAAWFRDFGGVLADNRIGWAVWGWDEGFGLNRTHRNGRPAVDSVVASALGLKTA
ncbi:MAG: cellulase family glycosylhydrolase [Verrucomicrobiota bacterium]